MASPTAGRASFANGQNFSEVGLHQCRSERRAKESRFAACTSLLTSPATRKPPPKCGAFRLQPRGVLLR
jgi:hypothetical protein